MNSMDVARTFFARMDTHDTSGALALVAPHTNVALLPLNLQGDAENVGRQYFEQLMSAFPDLSVRVRRPFVGNDNTAVGEITIEGIQAADSFGIINPAELMDLDQDLFLHVIYGINDRIK